MKLTLPGTEIASIRGYFQLTVADFAQVLAVHPGTVQRWEGMRNKPVTVDGVAASVFARARGEIAMSSIPNKKLGNEIVQGILVGGALVGLMVLLKHLTDER